MPTWDATEGVIPIYIGKGSGDGISQIVEERNRSTWDWDGSDVVGTIWIFNNTTVQYIFCC